MKKLTFCMATLFTATSLFAQVTFSGQTELAGSLYVKDYEAQENGSPINKTALTDTFAASLDAQLAFGNTLFLRTEFSAKTLPIHMDDSLIEKHTNTQFLLDEFSATLNLGTGIHNYISLFYGRFEPFGSDLYIQRHLGVNPITSELTRKNFQLNTCIPETPDSVGLSYALDLKSPLSFGTTFSANYDIVMEDNGGTPVKVLKPQFRGNLRAAAALQALELDSDVGVTVTTDKELTAVENVLLNGGLHLLTGNPLGTGIYIQADIKDWNVLLPAIPELNTMDAILEFRFVTPVNSLYLSLYGFGKDYLANSNLLGEIEYTDILLGGGINFKTKEFLLNQTGLQFGFYVNYSFMDPDFTGFFSDPIAKLTSWDSSFLVTPYMNFNYSSGKFMFSTQVDVWKVMSDPLKAFKAYATASFRF